MILPFMGALVLPLAAMYLAFRDKETPVKKPILDDVRFYRTGEQIIAKAKERVSKYEAELVECEKKLAAFPADVKMDKQEDGSFSTPLTSFLSKPINMDKATIEHRMGDLRNDVKLYLLIQRAIEADLVMLTSTKTSDVYCPVEDHYSLTLDDLNALGF